MSRFRNWCFTLNNPTEQESAHIFNINADDSSSRPKTPLVRYLVVGRETGDSGTPHLQGYIELLAAKRPAGVKEILGSVRVHLEQRQGTALQASQYCKKQDPDFYETGITPHGAASGNQGKRNDLQEVAEIIRSGASAREIFEAQPSSFIRYNRGITAAMQLYTAARSCSTQVIWRFGLTGTGKSRDAFQEVESFYPGRYVQLGDLTGRWFDGLTSDTRAVVYDEFDGSMPISLLLRLLDRYPCQVPVKGGMVQWAPKLVFITSQFSPRFYYGESRQWPALLRRICGHDGQVIRYTALNTSEEWSEESPDDQ